MQFKMVSPTWQNHIQWITWIARTNNLQTAVLEKYHQADMHAPVSVQK